MPPLIKIPLALLCNFSYTINVASLHTLHKARVKRLKEYESRRLRPSNAKDAYKSGMHTRFINTESIYITSFLLGQVNAQTCLIQRFRT
jgi:hypothetical protein